MSAGAPSASPASRSRKPTSSPALRTPPPSSASTAANADAYRFDAERRAHAEGGQAYLLERSLSQTPAALVQKPLTLWIIA